MKREIYVMLDSVSKNVGEPFTMANDDDVRRTLRHLADNPAVPDYTMRDMVVVHLGCLVFDDDDVRIVARPCPVVIARGENYCEKSVFENSEEADSISDLSVT